MPDATGLELIAQGLRDELPDAVLGTVYFRNQASVQIAPHAAADVLRALRGMGYGFLASVHGLDYFPEERRFGVHYQLIDMDRVDRIAVSTRVGIEDPHVVSVTPEWPTANHQEREIFDLFGVVFDGHPDMRRILMPEDYEGHPQRRDFPVGGEEILFTQSATRVPTWWK